MSLKERVKIIRELSKLSQLEFAIAIDVERSYISRLERGTAEPSEHVGLSICLAFDVDYDWFWHGKGEMRKVWEPKDIRQLYESNIVSRDGKSIIVMMKWLLDRSYLLGGRPDLLGKQFYDLLDQEKYVDDSILVNMSRRTFLRIRAIQSGMRKPSRKKVDIETAVLCLLEALGVDSQKDIFALLISKAARLPEETRKKLKTELECLENAEKAEVNY